MGSISDRFTFSLSASRACSRSVCRHTGGRAAVSRTQPQQVLHDDITVCGTCFTDARTMKHRNMHRIPSSCGFHSPFARLSSAAPAGPRTSAGRPTVSASLSRSYHPGEERMCVHERREAQPVIICRLLRFQHVWTRVLTFSKAWLNLLMTFRYISWVLGSLCWVS